MILVETSPISKASIVFQAIHYLGCAWPSGFRAQHGAWCSAGQIDWAFRLKDRHHLVHHNWKLKQTIIFFYIYIIRVDNISTKRWKGWKFSSTICCVNWLFLGSRMIPKKGCLSGHWMVEWTMNVIDMGYRTQITTQLEISPIKILFPACCSLLAIPPRRCSLFGDWKPSMKRPYGSSFWFPRSWDIYQDEGSHQKVNKTEICIKPTYKGMLVVLILCTSCSSHYTKCCEH